MNVRPLNVWIRQTKGRAKELIGRTIGDRRLEAEGLIDEIIARIERNDTCIRHPQFGHTSDTKGLTPVDRRKTRS
jgi:hypothetical protein